jgi:hypothetical protein
MIVLPYDNKTKISLYVAAAASIVLGFADLARGGTTISAFLLAIGYCALIPLAIWHSGPAVAGATDDARRPSYGAAALTSFAVLCLYLITMAPSTAMWDTSEYIAAAYVFGLPHPPGNPFFIILGHVFSLLPIAPNVAARINVLAAICSAVAAGVWFLIAEHVLRTWLAARWQRVLGGVLAALVGATAFTVWNQSVVNEKVYTVSLAGIALISWLAVRWSDRPERADSDRLLVMIAYLCGLGYANHMAGMLPAPAVAFAVLMRRPGTILRWKPLLACVVAMFIGITPFATQPIRAAYYPAINEGEPTACRTKLEFSCTFSKGTLDAFSYNFNRGQYGKPALGNRQASFGDQIGMWWMYFKWQWIRDPQAAHPFAQALAAATFLVLGLLGGWTHYQRDRKSFWYFGAMMFTMTLVLIFYLNFKLGASQSPGAAGDHEVRDRDYFYLWSFSAWGVWAALGLLYVWESAAALVGTEARRDGPDVVVQPSSRGRLFTASILVIALIPLASNWRAASRANHRATRNMAADLLNSVEPYGVLITVGDNDTFPLWYAQEVEGIRRDVVVAVTSLLNTDWYARGIIRRPIYEYDKARGPSVYRDRQWVRPSRPPLNMTLADADSVAEYYQLSQPVAFSTGDLKATIDASKLENGVLMRADLFVLRMIQDSWPQRPFYFARSAVGYPRALGLENNVLTQGLASKLWVPPAGAAESRDTVRVQGDGWLDVPRTTALWNDVFTGHTSVAKEGQWVDRPSVSMPALYVFTGAELSTALRNTGRVAQANKVLDLTRHVAKSTGLEAIVRGLDQADTGPAVVGDSRGVSLRVKSSEPMRKK